MVDLAIDTNIWVQAERHKEPLHDLSRSFMNDFLNGDCHLVIDFPSDDESPLQTSHIFHEYFDQLRPGEWGEKQIKTLAASGRIKYVKKNCGNQRVKNFIDRTVGNTRDRIFVHVAWQCDSQTLVSHDETDFPQSIRPTIKRRIAVNICNADEVEICVEQ